MQKNIQVILLGNKTDLENKRKVQSIEGANFSLKNNLFIISSFHNFFIYGIYMRLEHLEN